MDKTIKKGNFTPIDPKILIGKWVRVTEGPKKRPNGYCERGLKKRRYNH